MRISSETLPTTPHTDNLQSTRLHTTHQPTKPNTRPRTHQPTNLTKPAKYPTQQPNQPAPSTSHRPRRQSSHPADTQPSSPPAGQSVTSPTRHPVSPPTHRPVKQHIQAASQWGPEGCNLGGGQRERGRERWGAGEVARFIGHQPCHLSDISCFAELLGRSHFWLERP